MVSITVIREIYDYLKGTKDTKIVFEVVHEAASVANAMFALFKDNKCFVGGDVVTFKRDNKAVNSFSICETCEINKCEPGAAICENCQSKASTLQKPWSPTKMSQQFPPHIRQIVDVIKEKEARNRASHTVAAKPTLSHPNVRCPSNYYRY